MKTLANINTTITGTKLTLTADIVEKDYSQYRTQQTTIMHRSVKTKHIRHVQVSEAGVMVKTPGKNVGVMLEKQTLVELATEIEPKLSYAPKAAKSLDSTLTVPINSELTPSLQWQQSVDNGLTWTDIEGQTTDTLDKTKATPKANVRLHAWSEAGDMFTNPVKI